MAGKRTRRKRQRIIYRDQTVLQAWTHGPLYASEECSQWQGSGDDILVIAQSLAFSVHVWKPEDWKALLPAQRPKMATFNKYAGIYVAFLFNRSIPSTLDEEVE